MACCWVKLLPIAGLIEPSFVGGNVLLEARFSSCRSWAGILFIESFVSFTITCLMLVLACFLSALNMPITLLAIRFILLGLCPDVLEADDWFCMFGWRPPLLLSFTSTKEPLRRRTLPPFLASDLFRLTILP